MRTTRRYDLNGGPMTLNVLENVLGWLNDGDEVTIVNAGKTNVFDLAAALMWEKDL